ncbi:MAG TPA: hypothetical protein VMT03_17055 [Polyangia bacterium]|nr:hypothetical protein [Polyangia bacterium]
MKLPNIFERGTTPVVFQAGQVEILKDGHVGAVLLDRGAPQHG